MRNKGFDVMDFYRQLSLLLKSNLPLPESLRQMGDGFRDRQFQELLERLSKDTASGMPLSESMKKFPGQFPPYQIKMIEGGERSGTLSEILCELAYASQIDYQLVSMVRSFAAYPLFVIIFSFSITFFLFSYIVPKFEDIFTDLLGNYPLPPITSISIGIANFCTANFNVLIGALLAAWIFMFWIFLSNSSRSSIIFFGLIRRLPLSARIFDNLAMARISSMWSVMARQKMPAHEALVTISDFVEDPRISKALKNAAKMNSEGKPLYESLDSERDISAMLALTVRHSPEAELPRELENLSDIFKSRAVTSIRSASFIWELFLILTMSWLVGMVVIALFSPLITIIDKLGGCC